MIYAQINENDICIGISNLSGEVFKDNMIPIDSPNNDLFWRKWDKVNKVWSTEKYEPQSTAPITEFNQLKADNTELRKAIVELATT